MKGTQLGEFEELVLLTIVLLYGEACSVAGVEELSRRLERPMSLGTIHRPLQRLEEKAPLPIRRGRRKRLSTATETGEQALQEALRIRNDLWATKQLLAVVVYES